MSRSFAHVGVTIPAARLREIMAGASSGFDESVDVNFALAATGIKRAERAARVRRTRQRAVHWLVIAGLVIAALNLLICVGYGVLTLALHQPPM